jgi:uncharacterized protein (DUF885 family)
VHPIRNQRDAENYLARLGQVAARFDDAIAEARARAARGVTPPRFLLTATLEQTERIAPAEQLWRPTKVRAAAAPEAR